jgi:RNA polymerase sigma-54 factor
LIERALGIDSDERRKIISELATLDLRPGASVDPDAGRRMYVNPDLTTEWDGENYSVVLVNDWVPQIRISRRAMEALQHGDADRDFERYARSKYEAAKALVEAVRKRKQTLLHVGRILVAHQKDFLDHGPAHLKPLRMQEVAEKVGVHTSTVSRAVSGKYIQTHRGMFPLKDFFAAGTTSVDGRSEKPRVGQTQGEGNHRARGRGRATLGRSHRATPPRPSRNQGGASHRHEVSEGARDRRVAAPSVELRVDS